MERRVGRPFVVQELKHGPKHPLPDGLAVGSLTAETLQRAKHGVTAGIVAKAVDEGTRGSVNV